MKFRRGSLGLLLLVGVIACCGSTEESHVGEAAPDPPNECGSIGTCVFVSDSSTLVAPAGRVYFSTVLDNPSHQAGRDVVATARVVNDGVEIGELVAELGSLALGRTSFVVLEEVWVGDTPATSVEMTDIEVAVADYQPWDSSELYLGSVDLDPAGTFGVLPRDRIHDSSGALETRQAYFEGGNFLYASAGCSYPTSDGALEVGTTRVRVGSDLVSVDRVEVYATERSIQVIDGDLGADPVCVDGSDESVGFEHRFDTTVGPSDCVLTLLQARRPGALGGEGLAGGCPVGC